MDSLKRIIWTMIFSTLIITPGMGQRECVTPGKTPSTAMPICGNTVIHHSSNEICGGGKLFPDAACPAEDYCPDYFSFTCTKTGTWGFLLTPIKMSDYDWKLFDITDRDPDNIYIDPSLSVASNFAGTFGITGTSSDAFNLNECGGNKPPFSRMPMIYAGHNYLLMVSNWMEVPSEYELNFKGGTAEFGSTYTIQVKKLEARCSGKEITLMLNTKVHCSSICPDGTDWQLTGNKAAIVAAKGENCSMSDMVDMIVLSLSNPLPEGPVTLQTKKGSDGNTLVDACQKTMPEGQIISGNIPPPEKPILIKGLDTLDCIAKTIIIHFTEPFLTSSLAINGSDFLVTGPQQVNIMSAEPKGNIGNDTATTVLVTLRDAITKGGNYTISLQKGTDGNTLMDLCLIEASVGLSKVFTAFDKVIAQYSYSVKRGCTSDTLRFVHTAEPGNFTCEWTENGVVKAQGPVFERIYPNAQNAFQVKIGMRVFNNTCSVSLEHLETLPDQRIKAGISGPVAACPTDSVKFTDSSTGPVTSWFWSFGNGHTSTLQHPPVQFYSTDGYSSLFTVSLTAANSIGCSQKVNHTLTVYSTCTIAVPNAFTPNGDGLNDYLYPLNAWGAKNMRFLVYNRFGQLVWQAKDYTQKWDGTIRGNPAPTGSYTWLLDYTDIRNGSRVVERGSTLLIR